MGERDVDYDALAARLTDPEVPLAAPSSAQSGAAAGAEGRAFLLREFGSEEAIAKAMRTPGRPPVGAGQSGPSPVVRGAVTKDDFDALVQLGERSGKKQAVMVREAVHDLLARKAG
ncbi:MAG: hypothetical protein AAGC80_36475 [Rhodococcus sp. (in: high G+C Gram-positive bacteria)]